MWCRRGSDEISSRAEISAPPQAGDRLQWERLGGGSEVQADSAMDQKWGANGGDAIGGTAHSVGPVKQIFDANEDVAELGYRPCEKQIDNDIATERQCVRIILKLLTDVPSND